MVIIFKGGGNRICFFNPDRAISSWYAKLTAKLITSLTNSGNLRVVGEKSYIFVK